MSEINEQHPEDHFNEEPRNDFSDVLIGFSVSFGFFFLVTLVFTLIQVFA